MNKLLSRQNHNTIQV